MSKLTRIAKRIRKGHTAINEAGSMKLAIEVELVQKTIDTIQKDLDHYIHPVLAPAYSPSQYLRDLYRDADTFKKRIERLAEVDGVRL